MITIITDMTEYPFLGLQKFFKGLQVLGGTYAENMRGWPDCGLGVCQGVGTIKEERPMPQISLQNPPIQRPKDLLESEVLLSSCP